MADGLNKVVHSLLSQTVTQGEKRETVSVCVNMSLSSRVKLSRQPQTLRPGAETSTNRRLWPGSMWSMWSARTDPGCQQGQGQKAPVKVPCSNVCVLASTKRRPSWGDNDTRGSCGLEERPYCLPRQSGPTRKHLTSLACTDFLVAKELRRSGVHGFGTSLAEIQNTIACFLYFPLVQPRVREIF